MTLTISSAQFTAFEDSAAAEWDKYAAAFIKNNYAGHIEALRAETRDIEGFCKLGREHAADYQITGNQEVLGFLVVAMALGAFFRNDVRHRNDTSRILDVKSIPQSRRVALLGEYSKSWLDNNWDGSGTGERGLRLIHALDRRLPDRVDLHVISERLDGLSNFSPSVVTPENRKQFVAESMVHADAYGLRSPEHVIAYVGAAALHGVTWFDDPLFSGLREAIEGTNDPAKVSGNIALFYQRFL